MSQAATAHAGVEPAETPLTPDSWGKLGMWIFLAGDAVGFGALLAAYGIMRATSGDWPDPYHVLGINLTALMTFLLICSSVTMVKALEWLGKGDRDRCKKFLFYTALGGAIFVSLQAYEWTHLIEHGQSIQKNNFGATFFMLTGFHGMHVFSGVVYLSIILIRSLLGKYNAHKTYEIEIAGLYWHFVDLIWILVFTFVYLI